jgi:hypothetical protein
MQDRECKQVYISKSRLAPTPQTTVTLLNEEDRGHPSEVERPARVFVLLLLRPSLDGWSRGLAPPVAQERTSRPKGAFWRRVNSVRSHRVPVESKGSQTPLREGASAPEDAREIPLEGDLTTSLPGERAFWRDVPLRPSDGCRTPPRPSLWHAVRLKIWSLIHVPIFQAMRARENTPTSKAGRLTYSEAHAYGIHCHATTRP